MAEARYDGLADAYDAFMELDSPYHRAAVDALRRLLGTGPGRCLDLGCGGGHVIPFVQELGWEVVGTDLSADQLRLARRSLPHVELVQADATALPFGDESVDAAYATFVHTDFDDFAGALAEVRRVLRVDGRFVYVGNHPCFVGATQEHGANGLPVLHAGYRRAGRWEAEDAPGTTPEGWRARLGSFMHLPLGTFLTAFAGFTLEVCEELDDGFEYPKTIAVAVRKPAG